MKHKFKKFISILLALIIMLSVINMALFSVGAAGTSRTQAEALAWVKSVVGKSIDADGVYGAQCVDLILAYYDYLGVPRSSGNGGDYAYNTLPSGWSRIQGAAPQPGDILVYTGGYGHVAIFESTYSTYHQNFNGHSYVERITFAYNKLTNPYWGVIRPNFNTHTHSYSSSITKQPTCTSTGVRTFTCSCGSSYTESIPATGHKYTTTVIAPTTTEKGYTLHKCSVCGDSYKDNYINPPTLGSDGWYYCNALPSDVTADKYTIEYNNYYEKIQKTSPGSDWKNAGVVKNEWQNSGAPYTTYIQQPTSDSRVLVSEYYYHWCIPGAGLGSEGNYEQTSKFTHYDQITLPNDNIHITWTGNDNGHPVYTLAWSNGAAVACKSGEQCDGSFGYHDYRCKAWYKNYVYQNRVKIELYKYTKNSGWISSKDSSATSVEIRYKSNLGDVNSDGDVTIDDVTLIQKYLVSVSNFTTAQKEFADVNNDGEVNIDDATVMQKYLAGAITKLG